MNDVSEMIAVGVKSSSSMNGTGGIRVLRTHSETTARSKKAGALSAKKSLNCCQDLTTQNSTGTGIGMENGEKCTISNGNDYLRSSRNGSTCISEISCVSCSLHLDSPSIAHNNSTNSSGSNNSNNHNNNSSNNGHNHDNNGENNSNSSNSNDQIAKLSTDYITLADHSNLFNFYNYSGNCSGLENVAYSANQNGIHLESTLSETIHDAMSTFMSGEPPIKIPRLSTRAITDFPMQCTDSIAHLLSNPESAGCAVSGNVDLSNFCGNSLPPISYCHPGSLHHQQPLSQSTPNGHRESGGGDARNDGSESTNAGAILPSHGAHTNRIMSLSEMNQLDVDTLNSVYGLVMPFNKGNRGVKREWRNVGWFTTDEPMNEIRKKQRVSKWKSVDQINGLKIFYRCNKWKRTSCNYRMYVMYYAPNRICLNESGHHDHSTLNPDFEGRRSLDKKSGARVVVDAKPSSSQQVLLDQFIQNATQNAAATSSNSAAIGNNNSAFAVATNNGGLEHDGAIDRIAFDNNVLARLKSSPQRTDGDEEETVVVDGIDVSYSLNDGHNIAQLLQVATDMDLTFTFNSRRTCEYCFESNLPETRGKMVVLADLGAKISVRDRQNNVNQSYEEWRKADWKQFLWAVRGKCMNSLKGI